MKAAKWIMLVILLLLGLMNTAGAAPVYWDVNGHWYEVVSAPYTTWYEAGLSAQETSGYLATITSAEENLFIFNLIGGVGKPYWLGGFQNPDVVDDSTAAWEWVTGEAWTYSNWASGEPNNQAWYQDGAYMDDEDALSFAFWNNDGTWNDAPLNYWWYDEGGYVIEYETAPVPEPASMMLMGAGLIGIAGWTRRFRSKRA